MGAGRRARLEFENGQKPEIFLQGLKASLRAQCDELRIGRKPVHVSPAARDCLT